MHWHQLKNQIKNTLLLLGLGTIGLNSLALLLMLFNNFMLQQLSQQLMPKVLIELINGRAITGQPEANQERQNITIRRFIGETMTFLFTTSPQQPSATILKVSSGLIASEYQNKFRQDFFTKTLDSSSLNNDDSLEKLLIIQKISEPEKIAEGKWKVNIFANQLIFSNLDKLGKSIEFNKQILIKTIDQPAIILSDNSLPLNLVVYQLAEARLQIFNICDLKEQNCGRKNVK
ncbi:hypothetical protein [Gloeothece verrucosa]|uniref:Uncharacterized protein n=1 Tax=Gloeothece verrucosa (strain PCC 7822) TaxID=497965 RepID=E0UKT9_GLOV7|nr:hypothetical protein [Gloeothece verrucosa]ADN17569.1 conserved hypothetical protein [Gloeothece verrucosa PCC 7822]